MGRVQRLSRTLERELRQFDTTRHGLKAGEFDVLTTLRRSGPPYRMTAGAFLKASMITSGAVTRRIDRMEVRGLVERVCPQGGDRRSVQIQLTEKGKQEAGALFPQHLENEVRMLSALGREESDELARLLRKLLESHGDTSLT